MTTTATASRQGTGTNNADGAATFAASDGTTGAAVIDLIGHQDTAPFVARLLAETAARTAAQRGAPAGLLTAGLLVTDPGAGEEPEPDGVAVVAVAHPDGETVISWIGDAHGYGWDGTHLRRYTTPHTYGQQLRQHGAPWEVSETHNDWIQTSLSHATPAGIFTVTCTDSLVILASDGLDALGEDGITSLVQQYADDPQALADALTAAVPDDETGTRDDATVIVLRSTDIRWEADADEPDDTDSDSDVLALISEIASRLTDATDGGEYHAAGLIGDLANGRTTVAEARAELAEITFRHV